MRENGVELCKLGSGSFCTVQVPVGKHEYVTQTEAKDVLTLEVESGETYYVQASISMGVMAGHANLAPSTKEVFDGMKDKAQGQHGQGSRSPRRKEDKSQRKQRPARASAPGVSHSGERPMALQVRQSDTPGLALCAVVALAGCASSVKRSEEHKTATFKLSAESPISQINVSATPEALANIEAAQEDVRPGTG